MRLTSLVVCCIAGVAAVQAAELQPRVIAPVPGVPGTATPTPYPQIPAPVTPRASAGKPGAPLLPPIPLPAPPKDQPLPGLTPDTTKPPAKDN